MSVFLYMNRLAKYFSGVPDKGMKLNQLLASGKTLMDDEVFMLVKEFESDLSELFCQQDTILERIGYRTFYFSQSDTWLDAETRDGLMDHMAQKEQNWIGIALTGACDKFDRLFTESVLGRAHNGWHVRHVAIILSRGVIHPETFDYLRNQPSLVKYVRNVQYWRLPVEEVAHRWMSGQTLDAKLLSWR